MGCRSGKTRQKISYFVFLERHRERGRNDEEQFKYKIGLANSHKTDISRSAREPHYLYHIEEMWQLFGSGFDSSAMRLCTTSVFGSLCNSQKEVFFQQDPFCTQNYGICSVPSAPLTQAAGALYLAFG